MAGPGILIKAFDTVNTNLTVTNVTGFGTGTQPQQFISAYVDQYLIVTGSRLSNVWGMLIGTSTNGNYTVPRSLTITDNIAYNINSPNSTTHFLQLAGGYFPSADISNNIVINAPFKSNVNDVFNFYQARGSQSSPIEIYNNKILGGYSSSPTTQGSSGVAIQVDGGNASVDTSSAYIEMHNNIVVGGQGGPAIATGHDNSMHDNLVVSSGVIYGNIPVVEGIGIVSADEVNVPSIVFNNIVYNNQVFWFDANPNDTNYNHVVNWWLFCPYCQPANADYNSSFSPSTDTNYAPSTLSDAISIQSQVMNQYFK